MVAENMPSCWSLRRNELVLSRMLLGALTIALCSVLWGIDEMPMGPGRISELVESSEYILIAECQEDVPSRHGSLLRIIKLAVIRKLKGKEQLSTVTFRVLQETEAYGLLRRGKVILFLRKYDADVPWQNSRFETLRLAGPDLALGDQIERYIRLAGLEDREARHAQLKRFVIENLRVPDGATMKPYAAQLLVELSRDEKGFGLTEDERNAVAEAALASTALDVVDLLSAALDPSGSAKTADVALHAVGLALKAEGRGRYCPHLPVLVGKHQRLFDGVVAEALRCEEPGRLGFLIGLLHGTPEQAGAVALRRLWIANASARPVIRHQISFEAPDAYVERYLSLKAMPERQRRNRALAAYFMELVGAHDVALRELGAGYLYLTVHRNPELRLSQEQVALVFQAAMKEKSSRAAAPLCRTLEAVGSPRVVEACRHALLETNMLRERGRIVLDQVIAKHQVLVDALVEVAADAKTSQQVALVLRHSTRVPDNLFLPAMRRLWSANAIARPVIREKLKDRQSPECEKFLKAVEQSGTKEGVKTGPRE